MWVWFGVAAAAAVCGLIALGSLYLGKRKSHYQELARNRPRLIAGRAPRLLVLEPAPQAVAAFGDEHLLRVGNFLEPASLQALRDEAMAVSSRKIHSYVPTHKKGGTIAYEQIHEACPSCLAFYHCKQIWRFVSQVVGENVGPAGDHDQSAESILYYDEAGDHIHWHFDHNFYEGRQFTALINLVNRSAGGGCSASTLVYKNSQDREVEVDTSENTFVIFEGSQVLHRATPTAEGDLRIMLSMTFNTAPRISAFGELKRRIKDTAFFGLRVLWK
ncbi:MAG: 2OG-Fe(II) oxygenase [Thermoguttaceae bacterium]